jgi:hypothetical protein
MEPDECEYIELNKNQICKYFVGNSKNQRDIECCYNHCSLKANKKLMQDGVQPLIRKHNRLTQKGGRS